MDTPGFGTVQFPGPAPIHSFVNLSVLVFSSRVFSHHVDYLVEWSQSKTKHPLIAIRSQTDIYPLSAVPSSFHLELLGQPSAILLANDKDERLLRKVRRAIYHFTLWGQARRPSRSSSLEMARVRRAQQVAGAACTFCRNERNSP